MTTLGSAFVELHADGTRLPAEITASASAGAESAEATITRSLAEAGVVGGRVAGEAIEQGVEGGAERGARSGGVQIVEEVTKAGAAAGVVLREEMVVAGSEAGDEAGDRLSRNIFSGIAKGGAAGAAALRAEMSAAGLSSGHDVGRAVSRGLMEKLPPGAMLAAGAIGTLALGIGLAANEALDAQAASDNLTQSLLNNAAAATIGHDRYIELSGQIQDLTGYEDEQVQATSSVLSRFKMTGDEIERLLPLVADFAAATGRDMPDSAKSLGRVLLGNTRSLKEIGGQMEITGDHATDLEGLIGVLETRVGGFAERSAKRLDGQLRILQGNIGDIGETIGGFFLPTLTALSSGLNFGADAAAENANQVSFLDSVLITTLPGIAAFNQAQAFLTRDQRIAAEVQQDSAQAFGLWIEKLDSGKISVDEYRDRMHTLVESAEAVGLSEQEVAAIRRSGRSALKTYLQDTLGLADAHKATALAAKQQQLAELALAGGFIGVAANMQQYREAHQTLAEAQAKVNKLEREGKKGTDAYREAVIALRDANIGTFQAGLTLTDAVGKLSIEMDQAGASGAEVREEVRKLGEEYNLNREQVRDLIVEVDRMIGKQKDVRGDVTMHFHAEGLDEALRKTQELADALADIPNALASPGRGPDRGRGRDVPNSPQQRDDSGTGPVTGGARVVPSSTSVEIELDGKIIYESNESVGRRQKVRFSGRDDG